jgi:AcrR family transcriptional regulator
MRYSAEHKKETRSRILNAAGRLFRQEGFGGAGIDGLTKAAGVTNGAFYGHFKTKSEAFKTVMLEGMTDLKQAIARLRVDKQAAWITLFVEFYMGFKRTCDLGESCALPSLSPEVVRADEETRVAYEEVLKGIIDEIAMGMTTGDIQNREDKAIALLAMLSGGVTMARAVSDPKLSERIAHAVQRHALELSKE